MSDVYAQRLASFEKKHDFFIGIDSDGCVFDTMEIKHKECFIPNIIRHFGLQAVSKFARDAAEFVNLYSVWRGVNRFPALTRTLDLLEAHPAVQERGFVVPRLTAVREWLSHEARPANPSLEAAVRAARNGPAEELRVLLAWSVAVNDSIRDMVRGVPPFPHVRKCLEAAAPKADIVVVSATPTAALEQEWAEHDIARFAAVIAGQEMGTKAEHLRIAAAGRYPARNVLMVGDAPSDLKAARTNGFLFFPINPGAEAASWDRFRGEALPRFFSETYAGEYEAERISEFEALLPDTPPWSR